MKVTLPADYKKELTVHKLEVAKKLIKAMHEDETTTEEYALSAARIIAAANGDWASHILDATATIGASLMVWNAYSNTVVGFFESEDLEIYITATARTRKGFIEFTARLSDVFKATGDNSAELVSYMFYRIFNEVA